MPSGQRHNDEQVGDGGQPGAGDSGAGFASGDAWEPCPAGALTQMVRRLDARQRQARRRQVVATALVSTGVFACVVIALGSLASPPTAHYGGISCSECRHGFAKYQPYVAGVEDFDQATAAGDAAFLASMKTHLEKCTFCRERFNATYPDQRLAGVDRMGVDRLDVNRLGRHDLFGRLPILIALNIVSERGLMGR